MRNSIDRDGVLETAWKGGASRDRRGASAQANVLGVFQYRARWRRIPAKNSIRGTFKEKTSEFHKRKKNKVYMG